MALIEIISNLDAEEIIGNDIAGANLRLHGGDAYPYAFGNTAITHNGSTGGDADPVALNRVISSAAGVKVVDQQAAMEIVADYIFGNKVICDAIMKGDAEITVACF